MSTKTNPAAAIKGNRGELHIVRDGARVTIRPDWFCGAYRSFTPEDMVATVDLLETVEDAGGGGVWVTGTDSDRGRYAACVEDGRLFVHESVLTNYAADEIGHVSWTNARRAMLARSKGEWE